MIALDTNVLLRYLYEGDDPAQAALAKGIVDQARMRQESIYIPAIVLCELLWTLVSSFNLSRAELLSTLQRILSEATDEDSDRPVFVFENEDIVRQAVEEYAAGSADFADYLIGRLADAAGATTTYTFDREAADAPTFKRLRR